MDQPKPGARSSAGLPANGGLMRRTLNRAGNVLLLLGGIAIGLWLFGLLDTWVARSHVVNRVETLIGSNEPASSSGR
jgi:hypothetical protein